MALRIEYRHYTHPRGARFKSGNKELVLRAPQSFALTTLKGVPQVLKDGVLYPIKKSLVRELKSRSEVVKPSPDYKERSLFLNEDGLSIVSVLRKNLAKLSSNAEAVKADYANGRAYLIMPMRTRSVELYVGFTVTDRVAGLIIYLPSADWDYTQWDQWPVLQQRARKLAKYLTDKYGLTIDKKFSTLRTKMGNIPRLDGAPFTGTTVSYLTKWSF